ncbi:MAG: aquaporin [Candidatus Saccharibacteria bacterium]|nr:aquaporin [Candidatus Saccharibacteria bacterium]
MATTKAKSAKKSGAKKTSAKSKAATSKPKTVKAVEAKTTKKAKVTKVDKVEKKADKVAEEKVKVMSEKTHPVKEFFARKFDASENILTIFKDTKIIGAIIGEIIGTGLITGIALTLGLFNPLYLIFGYLGVTLAVFALSGAHLNPIITVGMMASRRVSAIRGVLYLIAQVIGAWLGFLVVNGFYNAGIASGNITADSTTLPALTPASDITAATEGFSFFWAITMLEFAGAIILAFFFARALVYKRSPFTFAITVAAGVFTAMLFSVVISSSFLGVQDNIFVLNPATAFVYGLLPSSAEGFDALMGALMPMLVTYAVFPMLGGIIGFYLSDFASKLSGKELAN